MSGLDIALLVSLAGLSVPDIKKKVIPVRPVVVLGGMLAAYRLWNGAGVPELGLGLLPGAVLLVLSLCTRESIGYGDGLVFCAIGIGCGVERTLAVLGLSLLAAAVTAIIILVVGKGNRKTELPFLPCVCLGYVFYLIQ